MLIFFRLYDLNIWHVSGFCVYTVCTRNEVFIVCVCTVRRILRVLHVWLGDMSNQYFRIDGACYALLPWASFIVFLIFSYVLINDCYYQKSISLLDFSAFHILAIEKYKIYFFVFITLIYLSCYLPYYLNLSTA